METRARRLSFHLIALVCAAFVRQSFAQGTNGTIEGRITEENGRSLPGTTVTIESQRTGMSRMAIVDDSGSFRVAGLPIGPYLVRAEAVGAQPAIAQVDVNVAATTVVGLRVPIAMQTEALSVTTAPPLIDTRDSGVGEIVTQLQIDSLPLNGRQFANLAALVPGVGLGFLVNIGKATQFAPQVAGGSGRNVNYLVDGGEQNDGRRGGLGPLFPLDSIEEFDLHYRARAEYGRSSASVLNVVTKSGRNELAGTAFGYFRDRALNARTESERIADAEKEDFRRYQFGGTLSGPLKKDQAHFFVSFEGVHQDTSRSVDSHGLFPELDGKAKLPLRERLLVAKLTSSLGANRYASFRYAFNDNSTIYPYDERPADSWTRIGNTYHSANASLGWVLTSNMLNECVAQFSSYDNPFTPTSAVPVEQFPDGFGRGSDLDVRVQVRRLEMRDDVSLSRARHLFKFGAGFITEPTNRNLHAPARPIYVHLAADRASSIGAVAVFDSLLPLSAESFPTHQYSVYAQDSWHPRTDFILDFGVRYDLATGFAIDQSKNPLFQELQAAGQAGYLAGAVGLEDFGKPPAEDKNNVAPRFGFVWDRHAEGTLVVRGGGGRYYDLAYTESTVGRFGIRGMEVLDYYASDPQGLRRPDGAFLRAGDPLLAANAAAPFPRNVTAAGAVSPRIKQPFTDQANVGASKALGEDYVVELDAIFARGRDVGIDPHLNTLAAPDERRFASALPTFGNIDWGVSVSRATSRYEGVSVAVKKKWNEYLQFVASYTLSRSTAVTPLGTDDTYGFHVIDARDPFGAAQKGPTETDALHRVTVSSVWRPTKGLTVGTVFRYRSATPYTIITGRDDNRDGANFDLPAGSKTLNQVRGSSFSQLDIRLAQQMSVAGSELEVILEAFNLFNSRNPADYDGNMQSPGLGGPTSFAGDLIAGEARQGEQRQFRIGLRVRFGPGAKEPVS